MVSSRIEEGKKERDRTNAVPLHTQARIHFSSVQYVMMAFVTSSAFDWRANGQGGSADLIPGMSFGNGRVPASNIGQCATRSPFRVLGFFRSNTGGQECRNKAHVAEHQADIG